MKPPIIPYTIAAMRPEHLHPRSAWVGHTPFAFVLVEMLRPRLFVELGVHTGVSFCAFLQAAKYLGHPMRAVGVDTWEPYFDRPEDGDILASLRAHVTPRYKNARLLQMTCDEGRKRVRGGIDLLHIDAGHSYDEVKHDFETWRAALSARGVVIFHDTVHVEPGCDVRRFWREVRQDYPHFEFDHAFGLGLLAVGPKVPPVVLKLCRQNKTAHGDEIRAYFRALGIANMLHLIADGNGEWTPWPTPETKAS